MARTIVMIHGFRGTHHGLALIAAALAPSNTIIPDLPGFADGATLTRYDLTSYVRWLHDYIASLALDQQPILLGHSFGSIICAAYAVQYPQTIERLILVNPIGAPALQGPRRLLTSLAVSYYQIGKWLPERLARSWLSSTISVMVMSVTMAKTKHKPTRRYIHDQHRQYFSLFHTARSVYEGFLTSVRHSVLDNASLISMPTLLIAGDRDDITPLAKQQHLVKLFPKAQLKVIKGVGHLTHYETPEAVAHLIQAFIKSE